VRVTDTFGGEKRAETGCSSVGEPSVWIVGKALLQVKATRSRLFILLKPVLLFCPAGGASCPPGFCCTSIGYCGEAAVDLTYCSLGCQQEFSNGLCLPTVYNSASVGPGFGSKTSAPKKDGETKEDEKKEGEGKASGDTKTGAAAGAAAGAASGTGGTVINAGLGGQTRVIVTPQPNGGSTITIATGNSGNGRGSGTTVAGGSMVSVGANGGSSSGTAVSVGVDGSKGGTGAGAMVQVGTRTVYQPERQVTYKPVVQTRYVSTGIAGQYISQPMVTYQPVTTTRFVAPELSFSSSEVE
jgi:hypothetical protein